MRIGLGQDGTFDCSGLIWEAFREVLKLPGYLPELRHTRQMVEALEAAGEQPRSLSDVVRSQDASAVGSLIFTRRWHGRSDSGVWRIAHVSILTDYTEDGQYISLHAQAGYEGQVVERPPYELPPGTPDRLVFSSTTLADLIFERFAEVVPVQAVAV